MSDHVERLLVSRRPEAPHRPLPASTEIELVEWGPMSTSGRDRAVRALPPTVLGVALFAWFTVVGLHRFNTARANFDLAYFTQASWLISHGDSPEITVRGLYLLADHSYFIMWPLAYLNAPFPTTEGLVVQQALGLSLAIWPLYALCRQQALTTASTVLVLVAYALFPALHNLNGTDWHPEFLVVPLFLTAVLCAGRGSWIGYGLCVGTLLLNREDVPLTVLCLGILVAVTWSRKAGFITVGASLVVLVVVNIWVIPHFVASGPYASAKLLPYGSHVSDNVLFVMQHPTQVVQDLFAYENSTFVVALLAPVAFLPLLSVRWLLPALPVQILLLLSRSEAAHTIDNQYTAQITPFVFLALVHSLKRVQGSLPVRGPALLLVSAALLGWLGLGRDAPGRPDDIWAPMTPRQSAILALTAEVPAEVPVAGGQFEWVHMAERKEVYPYPWPAGAQPQWVVLEKDEPRFVTKPLPANCHVAQTRNVVVLARCSW